MNQPKAGSGELQKPRQRVDLHVHTTASDGTLTPEQVVDEAVRVGLSGLAIADHDSVEGVPPGLEKARSVGLILVPAVEINTDFGKDEIHILGYYIDPLSDALNSVLQRIRSERAGRAAKMVERLNALGMKVDLDRILQIASNGSVGRPHLARALVEAGYASTLSSAFGKYLVRGAPAYVPRYRLEPAEAIAIILEAGGVPVLAHPGLNKHDEMIPRLVEEGLRGIEAYHTDHTHGQTQRYLDLAARYGLVVTGGSDSHGPNNIRTVELGSVSVEMDVVRQLQDIADSRK